MLLEEGQHVPLGGGGEAALALDPLLHLPPLPLHGLGGVEVAVHVPGAGGEAREVLPDAALLLVDGVGVRGEGLGTALLGTVGGVHVHEVLEGERVVEEPLHLLLPVAVGVPPDARPVVRHLVDHLAVGRPEPEVVLEEVGVAVHVGDDDLLVRERVRAHEVGVAGVVVDDELVDLLEAVLVALAQLLVLHPEAPVRVAGREAPVGGDLVERVVVEDLEEGLVEVEAVLLGVAADAVPEAADLRGKRPAHRPVPRKVRMEGRIPSRSGISVVSTRSSPWYSASRSTRNCPLP